MVVRARSLDMRAVVMGFEVLMVVVSMWVSMRSRVKMAMWVSMGVRAKTRIWMRI